MTEQWELTEKEHNELCYEGKDTETFGHFKRRLARAAQLKLVKWLEEVDYQSITKSLAEVKAALEEKA